MGPWATAVVGQNFRSSYAGLVRAIGDRCFTLALSAHAQPPAFTAQVVAVHDGDTITVRTTAETLKVRVAGVDCPEIGQPWSSRAKQFTSQLVFGKTVTIETHGTRSIRPHDRTRFRRHSRSQRGSCSAREWRGATRLDPRSPSRRRRARRTSVARRAVGRRGTRFRRGSGVTSARVRTGSSGSTGSSSSRSRTARVDVRDARGPFHGNVHSHVYHRPGCPHYNCKSCEETFLTTQSAEEAGYHARGRLLARALSRSAHRSAHSLGEGGAPARDTRP